MNKETIILDGKSLAEKLLKQIKKDVEKLKKETDSVPHLVVCLVGDDPASTIYTKKKQTTAEQVGMKSTLIKLPADISQESLATEINSLSQNSSVNGILLQLPLPAHLSSNQALMNIAPEKDVDGLTPLSLGNLMSDNPIFIPCTPFGIMTLLEEYKIQLAGKKALVLGRSILVGKPIAQLLLKANATVTMAHSKTKSLENSFKEYDIIVSAIGQPNFIKGENLKENCTLVDVGINRTKNGKLTGDADYQSCLPVVGAITPVPGGVGPLTVAHLLVNTLKAFNI